MEDDVRQQSAEQRLIAEGKREKGLSLLGNNVLINDIRKERKKILTERKMCTTGPFNLLSS